MLWVVLGVTVHPHFHSLVFLSLPLALVRMGDRLQTRHSVLRNYLTVAHIRWFFEGIRPEFRQYFFESDISGTSFYREQRSLVYQRARDVVDRNPFGTDRIFRPRRRG